jgi:predicted thioesterase
LTVGLASSQQHTVQSADTAPALGSGSVPVFATPRLLAWLEQATCAAIDESLEPGTTSVGTRINLDHQYAAVVGAVVTCRATLAAVDGRLLQFDVSATDEEDRLLATGQITRVVVDVDRFMARLSSPLGGR